MDVMPDVAQDMLERMQRLEDLHPDLEPYLSETVAGMWALQHPLVYELFYRPGYGGEANARYEWKREQVAIAVAERNWSRALHLYERPYRINKLVEYAEVMTPQEYWSQLAWVWIDCENVHQYSLRRLEMLFNRHPPPRAGLMRESELQRLSELPPVVTIFRGKGRRRQGDLSWTLSQNVAFWFAKRWKNPGDTKTLLVGEVRREKIWAYFEMRNEEEIVVPYRAVKNITKVEYRATGGESLTNSSE